MPPRKSKKPKVGVYIEIVMHGHGCHEIIGAWDVPVEKVEELQKIIDARPELFTVRQG